MTDEFDDQSTFFLNFLASSQANVSSKIELADLRHRGAGRGVVAKEDIPEGEILFSVPRAAVLSASNSSLSTKLPQVLTELDPWLSLILTMLYEYLRGNASPWKPYFDILPKTFDTLMFWADEELAELQASAVVQKIGKESANEMFTETVIPLVRQYANVFFPDGSMSFPSDEQLLEMAHCMGSIIMAYAFDIEPESAQKEADEEGYISEDEDEALPKGMVPMADMLNADADRNNARLHYGAEHLTMESITDIKKGDEIFNDYGALPRADLLRRYGYVTPNYAQYDVVEIPTDLLVSTVKADSKLSQDEIDEKLAYLEEQDLLESGYDITRAAAAATDFEEDPLTAAVSSELVLLVATLLLPSSEFARMSKKSKFPRPDITPRIASILASTVATRASQYATTLEQDRVIAAHGSFQGRHAMALAVRMGEKEILEEVAGLLAKKIQVNGGKREGDDERENGGPSKKRRVA
ncbi:RuBisCO-cytochrome methylase [Saccharata proteae CBS 121410]|uniref:RuBisCO-cytochrome methylase n=1 Tax=Saccharata proteae CBS 121410 TaxID=1314787 RepID=A0A9P4HV07_9PEZI|nr:RuBisCO-cytochrome methylase [Saccharata proteae CBS 121410]